jgi:hypothetical protein
MGAMTKWHKSGLEIAPVFRGTGSSNPSPSSKESIANFIPRHNSSGSDPTRLADYLGTSVRLYLREGRAEQRGSDQVGSGLAFRA